MSRSKRLGLASLLIGALAIPTAVLASYLQSIRNPGGGVILQWLEKHGLVNQPAAPAPVISVIDSIAPDLARMGLARGDTIVVSGVPEMTEASVLAVNDSNAIAFLFLLAIAMAAISTGLSLWAEYRREPSLFLGIGYICSALALGVIRPLAGFATLIAGVVVFLILRYQRGST